MGRPLFTLQKLHNEHFTPTIMRNPATKRFGVLFVLVLALACSRAPVSCAEDLAKIRPSGYVTDLAGTLNASSTANLEALCKELEEKTGAQMAIITVHSLEGRTVEDYAADLYKKLGVGSKKSDQGVLLLLSPDERKYRIEVGYGLEPVINDARAGDVGRAMVPYLRANDFNAAIQTAAWQLAKFIGDDRGVTLSGQPLVRNVRPRGHTHGSIFFWIFIIIIFFRVFLSAQNGGRGSRGSGWLWFLLGMLTSGGGGGGGYRSGGFGGGGGGYSGGGGFGGFGGGSSGGGGASGSW
jgi:uncharacterized protein